MTADCQVRRASPSEIPLLLEIAAAAQDKLARAGSAQQIAGYTRQNAGIRVQCGELYALEVSGQLIGSAFVEPVTPTRFPQIASWNAVPAGYAAWFLYGLVIRAAFQGKGFGRVLLGGICHQETFTPPAVLLLDCWAGSHKLRQFYSEAEFESCGEFPEEDYRIAVFRRGLNATTGTVSFRTWFLNRTDS